MARSNGSPRSVPSKIDRHIGQRLREVRVEKEVTVADLAARMGITVETLSRYESGDCPFRRLRPADPTHRDHLFRFIATGVVWGLNVPVGCFG